jgi:hypothetical protein
MAEERGSEGQVEPRLSPQLADLMEKLRAGTHHGEFFEVSVTDRELEQAIAWYVDRQSGIPLRSFRISIDPNGVEAQGEAHLGSLQLPLSGRANIVVEDGVPVVTVQHLDVGKAGLPDFVLLEVQTALNTRLGLREEDLPVIFEAIELEDGRLTVQGHIR